MNFLAKCNLKNVYSRKAILRETVEKKMYGQTKDALMQRVYKQ